MAWVDVKSKGLHNIPGFPEISNDLWGRTKDKLEDRGNETQPAKAGLTREYSLGVGKDRAKLKAEKWLFPGRSADLSLDLFRSRIPSNS